MSSVAIPTKVLQSSTSDSNPPSGALFIVAPLGTLTERRNVMQSIIPPLCVGIAIFIVGCFMVAYNKYIETGKKRSFVFTFIGLLAYGFGGAVAALYLLIKLF